MRDFILANRHGLCFLKAATRAIEALGSDIPKPEFIDLAAGWETFTRTGVALPRETVEYVYMTELETLNMLKKPQVCCGQNVIVPSLAQSGTSIVGRTGEALTNQM